MKVRTGFVSNSSSSSFVLPKEFISEEMLCALKAHCSSSVGMYQDSWDVSSDDWKVYGYTTMRNNTPGEGEGDLKDWMEKNGFPMHKIKWENN
jgi:hypothetical protein